MKAWHPRVSITRRSCSTWKYDLFTFLQKISRGLECRSKAKEESFLTYLLCAFCCRQFPWVMSMSPAQIWSCGKKEQQCCRAMKSTLPSWEGGAWTNIMPSTSKVVSRLMEFPEPGHRYVPCVISFVPCQAQNTHFRFHRFICDQSIRIRQQVFLGYLPCACHC